jgi:hypothetical protein
LQTATFSPRKRGVSRVAGGTIPGEDIPVSTHTRERIHDALHVLRVLAKFLVEA